MWYAVPAANDETPVIPITVDLMRCPTMVAGLYAYGGIRIEDAGLP